MSLLCVVYKLLAPHRLFDQDLDIKSKIFDDGLTAKQYIKEDYHKTKWNSKSMLDKKNQVINDCDIVIKTYVKYVIILISSSYYK
ncbi:MAG: hypothetical protein ACRD8W_27890 [Nitrososphaeraceae archaeon]